MDVIRFSLRLPKDLHEELTKSAEKERRSINEQILWILEKHLKIRRFEDDD